MDLLARREYSRHELQSKLIRAFSRKTSMYPVAQDKEDGDSGVHGDTVARAASLEQIIANQVTLLVDENLQSDDRFVESFINGRRAKGHGPDKIRRDLRQKSVSEVLVERYLDECDEQWLELARRVYQKKFGDKGPKDYREKAKRWRFMQMRGFPHGLIEALLVIDECE